MSGTKSLVVKDQVPTSEGVLRHFPSPRTGLQSPSGTFLGFLTLSVLFLLSKRTRVRLQTVKEGQYVQQLSGVIIIVLDTDSG